MYEIQSTTALPGRGARAQKCLRQANQTAPDVRPPPAHQPVAVRAALGGRRNMGGVHWARWMIAPVQTPCTRHNWATGRCALGRWRSGVVLRRVRWLAKHSRTQHEKAEGRPAPALARLRGEMLWPETSAGAPAWALLARTPYNIVHSVLRTKHIVSVHRSLCSAQLQLAPPGSRVGGQRNGRAPPASDRARLLWPGRRALRPARPDTPRRPLPHPTQLRWPSPSAPHALWPCCTPPLPRLPESLKPP
jgi:hypothetical protein